MTKKRIRYVLAYISLYIVLVLQTTLINKFAFFGVSPSLILVLVVCFSLMNELIPSAVFAAIAGLMVDVLGVRIIGYNALLMLYLSLGVVIFGQDFFRETPRASAILVAFSTFVYEVVFFIFSFAIFGGSHFFYMAARVILPECIYNSIVAIPIYFYVSKFLRIGGTHSLIE